MKRTLSIALVLALILVIVPSAFAADESTPADDPIISEVVAYGSFYFIGTTAYCSGNVTDPNKSIVATMTLSHGSSVVGSWGGSGTSSVDLEGNCAVAKGQSYTLVISGTVNGTPFSTTPVTKTC